jgi:DNA-binding XRE family transcriptional regulator
MSKSYDKVDNKAANLNLVIEKERIAMWLLANRHKLKMSQVELSHYTDVSQKAISQIETQSAESRLYTIAKLATFFSSSFCDIFNDGRPTREQSAAAYKKSLTQPREQ